MWMLKNQITQHAFVLNSSCWWFAKQSRNKPVQTACLVAPALSLCPEILQGLCQGPEHSWKHSYFPDNIIFNEYAWPETLGFADVSQTKSVIAKVKRHPFFVDDEC